ncbi:hypothetical protein COLO4_06570 [Corchorus olitorius]|uniref:Uncharacterized protein n=1 Tax=Corchorus olitorius TaxID=93759 RepID=A0A1R3KMM3_9ROSI|nr:hypothetical protein COLO4_06570 [Corchorus olitorius]
MQRLFFYDFPFDTLVFLVRLGLASIFMNDKWDWDDFDSIPLRSLRSLLSSKDPRECLKLPATYFKNCLEPRFATANKRELIGENGILVASKAIGREIMELDK